MAAPASPTVQPVAGTKAVATSSSIGRGESSDPPIERYRAIRSWTEGLTEPLEIEDQVIQSMPDASPTKWHLAHTTWFFETFLLIPHLPGYQTLDPQYAYLFNSYYNTLGKQFFRPHRGLISRPTVAQVMDYRHHVDAHMTHLLSDPPPRILESIAPLLAVGLNHEQQHQELLLTDLKHLLAQNPLHPVYRPVDEDEKTRAPELGWHDVDAGIHCIGDPGDRGFAYDNEGPRHRLFIESFRIASRPVTCGEFQAFIADGGYQRPHPWLSNGWAKVQAEGWQAPLYWFREADDAPWQVYTLGGSRLIEPNEPVAHVSLYEADAFARWAGARLPSEAEWEIAADLVLGATAARADTAPGANLVEKEQYHPRPLGDAGHGQFLGDVWEWTRSAYSPYPGYQPPAGALGEYNAKFMNDQTVLRGGSCATPASHIRTTYRNFFPSDTRWQFSGFRLAQDGGSR